MDETRTTPPIACTLSSDEAQGQLDEWGALRGLCRRVETSPFGATMWFDPAADAMLRAVVQKEAACCSFLHLAVTSDDDLIRLDIASDQAAAQPVIALLVAQASRGDTR
jgi:hypothetical protein